MTSELNENFCFGEIVFPDGPLGYDPVAHCSRGSGIYNIAALVAEHTFYIGRADQDYHPNLTIRFLM